MQRYIHKKHSRSRSITIRLNEHGEVVVTTPRWTPKFFIERTIEKSKEWIEKQRAALEQEKKKISSNGVLYLGEEYQVRIDDKINEVILRGNEILIHPVEETKQSLHRALLRWYKAQAEIILHTLAIDTAKEMKISFVSLVVRDQKSRWGSCSATKHLNFSWRLIMAPIEVIRYVVVHELAHIQHMNHSLSFWREVELYDPAYTSHRLWLKKHGRLLHYQLK